jgi:hypothetical protein
MGYKYPLIYILPMSELKCVFLWRFTGKTVSYRGETLNSITQVAGRNVIICLKVVSFLIKIIFIFFTDFKIWYWDLRLKDWNVLSANMAF